MTDTRCYSVADFRFFIDAESFLLDRMPNLQPFQTDISGADSAAFRIQVEQTSSLSLAGGAEPTVSVSAGQGAPLVDVFDMSGSWLFLIHKHHDLPVVASLTCDDSFTNGVLAMGGQSDRFCLNFAIKLIYTFATAMSGAVLTHASAVVHQGTGYLFLGSSGTGKSTHSSLWIGHIPGTELLNDDYPVVRLLPDGTVRVFGSPWSGKTACYRQEHAPVGAMVWLRQGEENRVRPLSPVDSYAAMLSSTSGFRPISSLAEGWHRTLEGICSRIPFYCLDCLPDVSAAELCFHTIHSLN